MKIPDFEEERVNVADAERRTNKRLHAAAFAALDDATCRAVGPEAQAYRERTGPLARVLRALSFARELSDDDADRFVHDLELVAQAYVARARRQIVTRMRANRHDVKSKTFRAVVALSPPPIAGMNDQEHAAALIQRADLALRFAAPSGLAPPDARATAAILHSAVVATLPTYAPADDFESAACPDRCHVCATIGKHVATHEQNGKLDKFTAARAALRAFVSAEKARDLVRSGRDFMEREPSSRRE